MKMHAFEFKAALSFFGFATRTAFATAALAAAVLAAPSSGAAAAAATKALPAPPVPAAPALSEAGDEFLTEAQFNALLKDAQKNKRGPAAAEFSEANLSPGFKRYRDEFLAVRTADELEVFLARYDGPGFDALDPQTKYFAAQLAPLRAFRGILWKLRPVVEHGRNGSKATHSMIVSALRQTAANVGAYLPTDQWRAGFDFVSAPSSAMSSSDQFQTMSAFQNALISGFLPKMEEAAQRVGALLPAMRAQTVFVWDNRMNYGTGTFDDGTHRYVAHGPADALATVATLEYLMHDVSLWAAYDVDAWPALEGEIGRLYGIDGFFPGRDLGVTTEDRVQKIREYASRGFLSLRTGGAPLVNWAGVRLARAAAAGDRALALLRARSGDARFALNPVFYRSEAQPLLADGVAKLRALLRAPGQVHSGITGETVTVDLTAFYRNPPDSLMTLLPTHFDREGGAEVAVAGRDGETLQYRNYFRGRAIGWNNDAWKRYVTSASGQDRSYMSKANRVLRSSLGTNYLAVPLGYYF